VTVAAGNGFSIGPRVTTWDGVEIATYDLGGDGPPLLLAHATGFHGRVWLPVAEALRSRFRCVAFDARGHGDSGKAPDGDYDWRGFAADTVAVVDGLGLGQPRAVGHSSGGAALLLAEEARPGTFASLYCYEPVVPLVEDRPASPTPGLAPTPAAAASEPVAPEPMAPKPAAPEAVAPDSNPLAAGARRRREVFASRDAAFANYVAKPPFNRFDPDCLLAYVMYGFDGLADGTVRLRCRGEDEARVYEMAFRHRAFQHLDLVTCAVTLACGGAGAHFGADHLAAMAARLTGARIDVHPDLGHFGPMEAPAQVAAAVTAAFAAVDSSPSGP